MGLVEAVSGRRPEGATSTSKAAFNWKLLIKFFCGWVATLIVAALTSAGELGRVAGWIVFFCFYVSFLM